MKPVIIDGKALSLQIKDEVRSETEKMKADGHEVCLAVILVGDDPASAVYVRNKKRACEYCGIRSLAYELPSDTSQEKLLGLIDELNHKDDVNGILVQLPLPVQIDEKTVIDSVIPEKDVDGFNPRNVGLLSAGKDDGFVSCTPAGIMQMLIRSDISVSGKECVVIGRSDIVGKPMAMLLMNANGTVTVAHSRTKDLRTVCSRADILVAAVGRPKMIDSSYVKEGAVVIDVGMDRDENGRLCGDVDFDDVSPHCSAITPVPGGVGPMTIAMLMSNCLKASMIQNKKD